MFVRTLNGFCGNSLGMSWGASQWNAVFRLTVLRATIRFLREVLGQLGDQ
jgi:hypothetical protein